jgi:hypothetical protein
MTSTGKLCKMATTKGNVLVMPQATQQSLTALWALNTLVEYNSSNNNHSNQNDSSIPEHVKPHQVCVNVKVSLERAHDKMDTACVEQAHRVKDVVYKALSQYFTETDPSQAQLLLQVYVVSARGTSLFHLQECLEWFLESSNGGTIYKSGRVGLCEPCWRMGQKDKVLGQKMAPQLVDTIIRQVNIVA